MMVGVAINGAVLRRFRRDRGWSQDRLANDGRAFAQRVGESSGLNGATICRLEKEKHPPSKATLRHVVGALELTEDELIKLLRGDEPPPRWLLELTREAQPQADPPPTEEKPPMDRRQFTIALPTVMVSHVARPSPTDPLRAETDTLTGDYATTSPQKLLPRLRQHLDALLRELRTKSMSDGVRRRLLVDISEIAAEPG